MAKYSEEIIQELEKYLRIGASQKDAATAAGIHEETFYKWMREKEADGTPNTEYHPEFTVRIKKAQNDCKLRNLAIIQKAAEKTWQAAAWWLERTHYDEYAIKTIQEHRGKDGGEILINLNTNGDNKLYGLSSVSTKTD